MSVGLSDDDTLFSCSVWRWGRHVLKLSALPAFIPWLLQLVVTSAECLCVWEGQTYVWVHSMSSSCLPHSRDTELSAVTLLFAAVTCCYHGKRAPSARLLSHRVPLLCSPLLWFQRTHAWLCDWMIVCKWIHKCLFHFVAGLRGSRTCFSLSSKPSLKEPELNMPAHM